VYGEYASHVPRWTRTYACAAIFAWRLAARHGGVDVVEKACPIAPSNAVQPVPVSYHGHIVPGFPCRKMDVARGTCLTKVQEEVDREVAASAGDDMALALTERVHGRALAEAFELAIEHDHRRRPTPRRCGCSWDTARWRRALAARRSEARHGSAAEALDRDAGQQRLVTAAAETLRLHGVNTARNRRQHPAR
jgi:hypothetical protein